MFQTLRRAACLKWPLVPVTWRDQLYRASRLGYWPNYRNPRTLHEKLVTILTEYPDPQRTLQADKLWAKAYARERVPQLRVAELLQVEADPQRLRFDQLPPIAMLKSNHSSGTVKMIRAPYDREALVSLAASWLRERWPDCKLRIERHYQGIEPRIFIEEFLGDHPTDRIDDYRFMVFHGRVEFVHRAVRHSDGRKLNFVLDRAWRPLPIPRFEVIGMPPIIANPAERPPPPAMLDQMLDAAERLAGNNPFVRVDLYYQREAMYFGEMTFAPFNSFMRYPFATDLQLGALLDIERVRRAHVRRR